MNKNVLVLNNSISEYHLIKFCEGKFEKIFTTGFIKPFYTSEKIIHQKIDYTNFKKIKKLVKDNNIRLVIPCANDLSLFSINLIKSKHSIIDNYQITKLLHDKKKFRVIQKKYFSDYISLYNKKNIKFPLLLKSKIGSGGKGVNFIENNDDLNLTYNPKNHLIEEYVNGSDHGIFTLIKNQKLIFYFIDTEQRFINPFTVSSTISLHNINKNSLDIFIEDVNRFIKSIKLVDGILHFQVKYTKEKKIKIIEVTRRIPGDMYLEFLKLSTNIEIYYFLISIYSKNKFLLQLNLKSQYVLRIVHMAKKNGLFKKIQIKKDLKEYLISHYALKKNNSKIKDYFNERIGISFFRFPTKKKLIFFKDKINFFSKCLIQ